uniref:Putative secreted protein n=1 Tax=Amblyomma parvum TaxID=251391 RepID=A0A023G220_AMBPA
MTSHACWLLSIYIFVRSCFIHATCTYLLCQANDKFELLPSFFLSISPCPSEVQNHNCFCQSHCSQFKQP